jgi:hypothetical protein
MTIEICGVELEALIRERMKSGGFQSLEEALVDALKSAPLPFKSNAGSPEHAHTQTGAELVKAMQSSPRKESDLEPERYRMPVSNVEF